VPRRLEIRIDPIVVQRRKCALRYALYALRP
jgi:hypothetical protein